jgi:hypothetical protein
MMLDCAYMIGPVGALKAASKILGIPVTKIKRGQYRIDVVRANKITEATWRAARQRMYEWIDNWKRKPMHGGCESGYRTVK